MLVDVACMRLFRGFGFLEYARLSVGLSALILSAYIASLLTGLLFSSFALPFLRYPSHGS